MSDRYGTLSKEEMELRREQNKAQWRQRYSIVERSVIAAVRHAPGEYDEVSLFQILGKETSMRWLARVVKELTKTGILTRKMYRDAHNRPVSGLLLTERAKELGI